ncbi:S8 family serine peptidase [Dactylosporangium sp. CA-092794]|uniref:S8 family serine peptidase n=1 Tax=Dactylosporangium sp. CA-092794 TaxID=3239929 RepID=UPI003D8BE098
MRTLAGGRSRTPARAVLAAVLAVAFAAAAAPALAAPSPGPSPAATPVAAFKFYEVRPSYQGRPERLDDIAERLLGTPARAGEILQLNQDREQPDGGRLTDAGTLHPGWLLVLPWDAVGPGVVLGPMPARGAATSPGPVGDAARLPAASTCAALPAEAAADIPWPRLRLAPDRAWNATRGAGVKVAVVDTGVDPAAPALAGRVAPGTTVGTGAGQACAGHGTALAGIVAAQRVPGSNLIGIAPEATIVPVTVDVVGGSAPPEQVAAALSAAVAAGARVVMLGVPADLSAPPVAAGISAAVAADVLVVVGAWGGGGGPGVLRVGAVAADDHPARDYPAGTVDVLAPGDGIVTIGAGGSGWIAGSGTDFAVPFAAGLAALVRSAAPGMSAADAARHIQDTSERAAGDPEDGGIIDPVAAVAGLPTAGAARGGRISAGWAVPIALLGVAVLALLALRRRRRPARRR